MSHQGCTWSNRCNKLLSCPGPGATPLGWLLAGCDLQSDGSVIAELILAEPGYAREVYRVLADL
jgi:hypothetical protein